MLSHLKTGVENFSDFKVFLSCFLTFHSHQNIDHYQSTTKASCQKFPWLVPDPHQVLMILDYGVTHITGTLQLTNTVVTLRTRNLSVKLIFKTESTICLLSKSVLSASTASSSVTPPVLCCITSLGSWYVSTSTQVHDRKHFIYWRNYVMRIICPSFRMIW